MNNFKKVLTAVIAAAGISCLGAAAACKSDEPDYYKLIFEGNGVDYILQDNLEGFVSGGTVRQGVNVRFKVAMGALATGTPTIMLNGSEIVPDEGGVYSFEITEDSKVTVEGIGMLYTVSLSKTESVLNPDDGNYYDAIRRMSYLSESGEDLGSEVKVEGGSDFRFKIKKSVYYRDDFTVRSNFEVLKPDENGVYTVKNLSANTTISVVDMVEAENFLELERGKGTKEEPYLLYNPIDLYAMAAYVNSDWYAGYGFYSACYKLMNDIDLEGEQLYVTGDNSIATAVFCGEFDGNNKTIKNFYITDEVVDQETYANEYLPYVGMFGYATATNNRPARISNLKMENAELRLHTAAAKQQGQTGGLIVGYGIGVEIEGCSVDGRIFAETDSQYFSYVGGVAGIMQSAYNDSVEPVLTYDSYITSCTSGVDITCSGSVYSAGGIVGYTISADYSAISYVSGCTSTGYVSGAMHAGGIAGMLGMFSSVTGSKASGKISAKNALYYNSTNKEDYYHAYAGGIVGFAETDTVIAYSYGSDATVSAEAASVAAGKTFHHANAVLGGGSPAGTNAANSNAAVVYECTEKPAAAATSVTITVNGVVASYVPVPIIHWYNTEKEGGGKVLDEYLSSLSGRSWGYYFDSALTQKVPYSFVPVRDVTLYCGAADYSQAAGTYYVKPVDGATGAYITLNADGTAFFRYGGLTYTCNYTSDGNGNLVFLNTAFGALSYGASELNGAHFSFVGRLEGDVISITGIVDVVSYTASGAQSSTSDTMNLTAVKEKDGFYYGKYTAVGQTFIFNKDGTGSFTDATATPVNFDYVFEDGGVAISFANGDEWIGTVAGGYVTAVNGALTYGGNSAVADDSFAGVWFMSGQREQIELVLNPTSANGGVYGTAKISYAGGVIAEFNAEYDVKEYGSGKVVRVFVGDVQYGELTYDATQKVLSGVLYSMHYESFYASVSVYKYDGFKGAWTASGGGITAINFNGKGYYDVDAVAASGSLQAFLQVKGTATVTIAGGITQRCYYSLSDDTSGTLTIGGGEDAKEYAMAYDGTTITLTNKKDSGDVITLTK